MRNSQLLLSQKPFRSMIACSAPTSSSITWGIGGVIEEDDFDFPAAIEHIPIYDNIKRKFMADSTSIERFSEDINRSVNIETSFDKITINELYEYDIIIPLIPKKKYEIDLEIISVGKAKHKIVDPDWI
ncbi:MAG: hypothetical protein A4E49_01008 [Methanosaeta sp. PtaU1.Bin112]|nr:MAG: hypothetical protein A4E49_01008 [Methanosaeta sp. PtaU1.Bin112]